MKRLACTLVFVLSFVVAFVSSSAAVTVRVDPATKVLPAIGSTFSIDIMIDGVTGLGAFEFDMIYDPSIVTIENIADVSLGSFPGSTGRTSSLLGPLIDNNTGLLETGAFSYGAPAGANGNGTLVTITFTVKSSASGTLDLKDVTLTDTAANSITVDSVTDGSLLKEAPPPTDGGGGGGGGCFIDTAGSEFRR